MTLVIYGDGRAMVHTSVVIPQDLRDLAKKEKISLSKLLEDSLREKLTSQVSA